MHYRDDKLKFVIFSRLLLSNLDDYVTKQLLLSFFNGDIFLNYTRILITILMKTL